MTTRLYKLLKSLDNCIIFQVANSVFDEACSIIVKTMESAVNLCLPLPVKLRNGTSWGDLK